MCCLIIVAQRMEKQKTMWYKKSLILLLFIIYLPILGGWATPDLVENSMKEFGFKLKKKQEIIIPYTDRKKTYYIFLHQKLPVVVINDYHNGFVEIQANYSSRNSKDDTRWNLIVKRTIEKNEFRDTIYRIFILGENK